MPRQFADTIDQCISRYGQRLPPTGVSDPGQTGASAASFTHDGYNFEVYFLEGKVQCETINKADNSLLSQADKNKIIGMESTGGSWAPPITAHGQMIWMRADGAAIDSYVSDSPLIVVMSASYLQLMAKTKAKYAVFPSEDEVRKFIVPGIKEDDVFQKFGFPGIRSPQGEDGELLTYCPMPKGAKAMFVYSGVMVYVKKGRVTDLEIIHGDRSIAK